MINKSNYIGPGAALKKKSSALGVCLSDRCGCDSSPNKNTTGTRKENHLSGKKNTAKLQYRWLPQRSLRIKWVISGTVWIQINNTYFCDCIASF